MNKNQKHSQSLFGPKINLVQLQMLTAEYLKYIPLEHIYERPMCADALL